MADLIATIDDAIGDRIEAATRNHHRRRLGRLGWARAFEPDDGLWAAGDPPPRSGNSVEVLIDGGHAFPEMASVIREASSHVHIAGWFLSPDVRVSSDPPLTLKQLLAEVAHRVEVRLLLWAGAPIPTMRRSVRRVAENLADAAPVEFAVDSNERPLHCHHEKIIVVDDEVAFVGGLDLTTRNGDRFDSSKHRERGAIGWHDATTRLRGPIVADVAQHFRMRWGEVTGRTLPESAPPAPAGDVEAQILRTVPEKVYRAVPKGDFRILEAYVRAFSSAEHFIYIESQYLWSPEIAAVLRDKLANPPSDDFRMVIVLPSKANTGTDDTLGQLSELAEADHGGGNRLLACTLYARAADQAQPIYVHAKIGIVDDAWLTIGSANLNDHSLFNDTEMNVLVVNPVLARQTRHRLWAEHLETTLADVQGDVVTVVDTMWKPIATEQLRRQQGGESLTHRLARLPHLSKRSKRLVGPIQSLFLDG